MDTPAGTTITTMPSSQPTQPSGTTQLVFVDESQAVATQASRPKRLRTDDTLETPGTTSSLNKDLYGNNRQLVIRAVLVKKHLSVELNNIIMKYVNLTHCCNGDCSCGNTSLVCTTCDKKHCEDSHDYLLCYDCFNPFCYDLACGHYSNEPWLKTFKLCNRCYEMELDLDDIDPTDYHNTRFWENFWSPDF